MKKFFLCAVLVFCQFSIGGDSLTFRGPDRDGHYDESGIVKFLARSGTANGLVG